MTRVTYVPLENGDNITTKFGGIEFRANIPVDVPDDVTVQQLVRKEVSVTPEGEPRYRGVEMNVPLVEVLKGNPYFKVEGTEQAVSARKAGRPRIPRSAEEYKSFAMEWFSRIEDYRDLNQRWEDEGDLREKLGVHDDGEIVNYLRPFFDTRYNILGGPKRTSKYVQDDL